MIQKKTHKKRMAQKCIVPGCEREARTRGVCAACYGSHRIAVGRGETTWDELAKAGLVLPERTAVAAIAREKAGIGGAKQ